MLGHQEIETYEEDEELTKECQEPGKHLVVPKSTVQGSITDKVLRKQ